MSRWIKRQAQAWGAWRAAWAGLADNPVTRYWKLTRWRRTAHIPPWRRNLYVWFTALAGVAVCGIILGFCLYTGQELPNPPTLAVFFWWAVVLPAYVVWLAGGLYDTLYDCTQLLRASGRNVRVGELDSLTLSSPLGGHDILLGALRALLPPLYLRLLVGCVIVWITITAASALADPGGSWPVVLALAPLTIGALWSCGVLAITALALLAVILGHHTRQGQSASLLSMLATVLMLAWLPTGYGMQQAQLGGDSTAAMLAWCLLGGLVHLGGLALILLLAVWLRLRPLVTLLGAFVLLILVLVALPVTAEALFPQDNGASAGLSLLGLTWAWGSLAPLNPLAMPSPYCWGETLAVRGFANPASFVLLVCLQLATIWLFATHALSHLAQRRREAG